MGFTGISKATGLIPPTDGAGGPLSTTIGTTTATKPAAAPKAPSAPPGVKLPELGTPEKLGT